MSPGTLRRGLSGHLHLICGLDDLGKSTLISQSFRAPMHLSKPWLDGETLVVNVVNPTAGLLTGDSVETQVKVESGACLLITTPSASRAYRTLAGTIELTQDFTVAAGGKLEVFPEMFIPQAGTSCRQRTHVDVESDGELLWIDVLAPGRVAMGESFEYQLLDWRMDIVLSGKPIVRERSVLEPGKPNLRALRNVFPNAYYGSIYWIGGKVDPALDLLKQITALQSADVWMGVSRLCAGGLAIKLLTANSPAMRRAIHEIRRLIHEFRGALGPDLRKL